MIDYNDMKDKIEEIGYYATEELLYDTYNALYMIDEEEKQTGQDIYAICLEGPPGAGKTAFAKTYTEICKKMVDDKTEMISYQCDATTGKSELFEDINVSAAITRDGRKVNIPGKLVEAIKKANEGHRVILFIDEYDKAREETDAFFLQLLQDGKINSTQHGDLEVKDEFKSHLQVIFCKNDMREEVSGPLSRRLRIIRLDLMRPELFFKLANRLLIEEKENKVNDGLLNLVTLMYEEAYNNREIYKRLPACSEMLIALEDADRLLKRANAPKHVIYNSIIKNMFKSLDDIKTFESEVANNNTELYNLINSMKSSKNDEDINKESINSLIARNIYKDTFNKLNAKMDELDKVTREYKERFSKLEEEKRIELENGRLVSHVEEPKFISNFFDEGAYVKRGYDIFKSSDNEWVDIGSINMPDLSRYDLVDKLVKNASKVGIKVYENPVGVLTNNPPFDKQMFELNNDMNLSAKSPENKFATGLNLERYSRGMGAIGLPGDLSSQSRFIRVAFTKMNSISGASEKESVSQFFHILNSVDQQRGCCELEDKKYEITLYTSCCNTKKGIYYYTTYDNHQITAVDMFKENLDSDVLVKYPLITEEQIRVQN